MNYFDTSHVYCQGKSEHCTGIALSRHKRSEYFVATKLSNFNRDYWSREKSIEMYHNSLKELQVDYIDYYLLHSVGGSMEEFKGRYIDNGIIDYLMKEREAGRIRNLGFSFHGKQEVFDEVLATHEKYHWDFVQIELNYLDWSYANEINDRNVDASYLYAELQKLGIPVVIMEPLLGGRLANLPQYLVTEMKSHAPERSVASWAFRYAGTPEGVLTVLSGMTYMEHLKDNLLSYCPLVPLTEEEQRYLDKEIAQKIVGLENIPCNDCKYCMPCPYGIDIPAIFIHYNKCKNEGSLPMGVGDEEYRRHRRQYLISLDRVVPRERQPDHCIGCHQCEPHCPQNIRITRELHKISDMIEELKRNPLGTEAEA
jgi:predicted aldo/keto reductase-like oxidoreductase